MIDIAAKLAKSREFKREINGWKLILTRPTEQEFSEMFGGQYVEYIDVAKRFVIGWEGVSEADLLVSGASNVPVQFTPAIWEQVIADNGKLWKPIFEEIIASYDRYRADKGDREKKS